MNALRRKIFFRVDASRQIGVGHLMRCLTLADALRDVADSVFIGRDLDGFVADFLVTRGFSFAPLGNTHRAGGDYSPEPDAEPNPPHYAWLASNYRQDSQETIAVIQAHTKQAYADLLVVDHYAIDARWHKLLRPHAKRIMVIDDLIDRSLHADLLLDQNIGHEADDYDDVLRQGECGQVFRMVGPRYALLRPEFFALRMQALRAIRGERRHVLVSFGGVDAPNATGLLLQSLISLLQAPLTFLQDHRLHEKLLKTQWSVVLGMGSPWWDQTAQQVSDLQNRYHCNVRIISRVDNMAELMADADFAFGAAGSTAWERCCLGLPSAIMVLADNQQDIAECLNQQGAAFVMSIDGVNPTSTPWQLQGDSIGDNPFCQQVKSILQRVLVDDIQVQKMRNRAATICDGLGVERVVDAVMHLLEISERAEV